MMNIKEDRTINKNNICNKFIGGAYRKPDYSIILSSNAISQLDSKKESLGLNLALWQRYFDAYFTYMAFDDIVQHYDQKNGDNYKKMFYFGDVYYSLQQNQYKETFVVITSFDFNQIFPSNLNEIRFLMKYNRIITESINRFLAENCINTKKKKCI